MLVQDWSKYKPFFEREEFLCKHTGKEQMQEELLDALYLVRKTLDQKMIITSGYRDPTHPIEAAKQKAGEHAMGLAVDIATPNSKYRYDLIDVAFCCGFNRIGIAKSFTHLGMSKELPQCVIWTY